MAVRTKQLGYKEKSGTDGTFTIYTCPAGRRTILKELVVSERNGGGGLISMFLLFGSGPGGSLYFHRQTMTAYGINRVSMWTVLNAGDYITAYMAPTGGGYLTVLLSGAELEL